MKTKIAVVHARRKVSLDEMDLGHDRPAAGTMLLRTSKTFISAGTELSIYSGLDPGVDTPGSWCRYPCRMGYANVGVVEALGEGVTGAKVGDRVFTMAWHQAAQFGPPSYFPMFVRVPDGVSDGDAAAARMAMVAITSLQVANLTLNDWVVVFGLGMVGNFAAQLFANAGARVIGVDPSEPRRKLAQRVGIEHVVGGPPEVVAEAVRSLTGGGAKISVDAVGDSRIVYQAAQVTAKFGQVILLGSPRAAVQMNATDLLSIVHRDWITLTGALEWRLPLMPAATVTGQLPMSTEGNLRMILDLMQRGRLKVGELVSHVMPAERIGEAYEALLNRKDEYWGVVLDWDGFKAD